MATSGDTDTVNVPVEGTASLSATPEPPPPVVDVLVDVGILLAVAAVAHFIVRRIVLGAVHAVAKRTANTWDDALIQHRVFHKLALIAPLVVIQVGLDFVALPAGIAALAANVAAALMAVAGAMAVSSLLAAADTIYRTFPVSKRLPIKGYVQIAQILTWIIGLILMIAGLLDESPVYLLSGLGAMTAVLLLIFKDTILSFVASIQIMSNRLVQVGDWISMPEHGADGDVIEIALHTVKVQNWDKTISTIPTYQLIDRSFQNYRNMKEIGGRRIKRHVFIDVSTIRFLQQEDIERLSRFKLLKPYFDAKREEILGEGSEDRDFPPNGRQLTNIGTLRAYIVAWLKLHPRIRQDLTFLVRQLQPTEHGLPLEIYIFTATTVWAEYEGIQADVFDHLLAVVGEFDLRVFQAPSDEAVRSLAGTC